ncbi:MAG: DUF4384 domain-containing protein [Candidatus Desulfacyla sp.]
MRRVFVALCLMCGLGVLLLAGCGSRACAQEGVPFSEALFGGSFSTLSELTDAFSHELAKKTEGRKVYLERGTIRDMNTGEVWNFSGYLQHELESSLSRHGFHFVYDAPDADLLVGAAYGRTGDRVRVFFKCHGKEGRSSQSWAYEMPETRLPGDAFQETLDGKIVKLVQDLTAVSGRKRVYVKPIREGYQGFVSDFSRSFTARLKTQMVRQWRGTEVVDERPVLKRLFESRGIAVKAKEVKDLSAWEAVYTDADTVLDGVYFVEGDHVTVALDIKDLKGRLFGSAQSKIPRELIPARLDNPQAATLSDLGDAEKKDPVSRVRILSGLGGDFPVYSDGETIDLFVQVNEPLYVYVYGINVEGDVTRLYPSDRPDTETPFEPGRLCALSDERHSFEYVAGPPFGMDLVKVFASTLPLPLPEVSSCEQTRSYEGTLRKVGSNRIETQKVLAARGVIHPRDLVDYYRGVAARKGARIYEDQVILETRAKGKGSNGKND